MVGYLTKPENHRKNQRKMVFEWDLMGFILVGGFNLPKPEKYEKPSIGMMTFPNGKRKNVPNHQPG